MRLEIFAKHPKSAMTVMFRKLNTLLHIINVRHMFTFLKNSIENRSIWYITQYVFTSEFLAKYETKVSQPYLVEGSISYATENKTNLAIFLEKSEMNLVTI